MVIPVGMIIRRWLAVDVLEVCVARFRYVSSQVDNLLATSWSRPSAAGTDLPYKYVVEM